MAPAGKMTLKAIPPVANLCCNLISARRSLQQERANHRGSDIMDAALPLLALVIYFAIWAFVIAGSNYFNKNVV